MRRALIFLTFLMLTPSGWAAPAIPLRKPVQVQEVLPILPSTLEEAYTSADEVVDVQIMSSEVRAVGGESNPHVRTFYTARLLRSHKGPKASKIVFTQAVGDLDMGDHILRAEGTPLEIGQRYIVFLRRNDYFGGRMLVGERSGAFKIRDGRVLPQAGGKLADEQRGLTESAFNDELDRLARRTVSKE